MTETSSSTDVRLGSFLKLAIPLGIANISILVILTTDVLMIGWLGIDELAAGILALAYFGVLIVFCEGVLSSVSVITSTHISRNEQGQAWETLLAGVILAAAASVPGYFILAYSSEVLLTLGQDEQLVRITEGYMEILALVLLPTLLNRALIEYLVANEKGKTVLVISMVEIIANIFFNYVFMFGWLGGVSFGIVGAGYSTLCVSFLSLLLLSLSIGSLKKGSSFTLTIPKATILSEKIQSLVKLGFPLGLLELATVGFFTFITFVVGLFGTVSLAAHGIAMQISEIAVIFAFGIGEAASIRVAYAIGTGNRQITMNIARLALFSGLVFILCVSLMLLIGADELPHLFLTSEQERKDDVVAFAAFLIRLSTLFLIADVLQIILVGVLRGFQDTRTPFLICFSGFWIAGAGSGLFFAFYLNMETVGLWVGLFISLLVVAVALFYRLLLFAR